MIFIRRSYYMHAEKQMKGYFKNLVYFAQSLHDYNKRILLV